MAQRMHSSRGRAHDRAGGAELELACEASKMGDYPDEVMDVVKSSCNSREKVEREFNRGGSLEVRAMAAGRGEIESVCAASGRNP
jgi:hypothetical protein